MGKKGDETKRLILEKAMALFAKKGFKNVTMKDICIDTGLSRGGLYRHYESTNQIFSEIIDILMNTQDNELSSKIENEVPAPVILDEILGYCDAQAEENVINLITMELESLESIYMVSHKEIPIAYDTQLIVIKNKSGLSNIRCY